MTYKEWLDAVEIPPFDNWPDCAKKLLILYNKKYNPDQASKIMKRLYSLFHENAANRWRRWDYVKPEAGFIMYAIRHRTSITTPMIMEISHESEMGGDFSGWHWYPIPKID